MPSTQMHDIHRPYVRAPSGTATACLPLQGTALFSGVYSTEVGQGAHERLKRSGFAGISSVADPLGPLDLEDFDALVFRYSSSTMVHMGVLDVQGGCAAGQVCSCRWCIAITSGM